ncbi:MAG: ABC transporter permease subunit [Nocardioidaceae bacterium]
MKAFVDFYAEQNADIVAAAKFIPLNEEQSTELADTARVTGLTSAGEGPTSSVPRAFLVQVRENGLVTSNAAQAPLSLSRQSPRWGERITMGFLAGAASLSVLVTVGIVLALLLPALEFFKEVSVWEFLTGTRWTPASPARSPTVSCHWSRAQLFTTVIALLIAVPFGLGAAVYLSEYASPEMRKILKPVLEVLAGIPSVVYGFFALQLRRAVRAQRPAATSTSGRSASWPPASSLGIMIIPTIASLSEDAMSAVPRSLRQGSLALGANRMRTTLRVVFPAARLGHRRCRRPRSVAGDRGDDDRGAGRRDAGTDGHAARRSSDRR